MSPLQLSRRTPGWGLVGFTAVLLVWAALALGQLNALLAAMHVSGSPPFTISDLNRLAHVGPDREQATSVLQVWKSHATDALQGGVAPGTADAHDVIGERTEIILARRLQFAMALLSIPMIGMLGIAFLLGGHAGATLWCVGYVGVTTLLVLALIASGRFEVLRMPHVAAVGALPVCLHCWLGGYAASGGVMLWALLVPIAATMFGFKHVWLWFLGVVVAAIAASFLYAPERAQLAGRELELYFVFNTVGFTMFLFVSVRYFVNRIDEEKARSDKLLLQALPAPIVSRLKRGQTVIADHLPNVTVVFADIVGFTPIAARSSPGEVVALLDEIFTTFDELAREHGVSKIKTIGDAYMAVAGAPEAAADHAARAARLALAMRDHVRDIAKSRNMALAMRIGLHTGEVVAGVIGIERFAYDLWGDTVNTASRMESHGQPDTVQITAATKAALGSTFTITERGPIEVKGRGTITTYLLER